MAKMVLRHACASLLALSYLFDFPERYVTREYLFTILNTLYLLYYPNLVNELDIKALIQPKEKE